DSGRVTNKVRHRDGDLVGGEDVVIDSVDDPPTDGGKYVPMVVIKLFGRRIGEDFLYFNKPRELEFYEHQPAKITRADKETGKMEPAIANRPGARIDSHITEPSSKGSHHDFLKIDSAAPMVLEETLVNCLPEYNNKMTEAAAHLQ
ncbi:hypothetical protein Gohar_021179, partial [Gossypium harknessii]|nr:hypothetical protein [Gossypium harknessii]